METQPRVDVLIPAYNAASTVEAAIGSIQAQTLTAIRIVVVDDGSTDDTPRILARMAAADPRIEVLTTPNGGIVDALNLGLAHCTAPYVARHDADDLAFPDRLALQVDFLEAHDEYVAVGGNAWHIDATGARNGFHTTFEGDVTADPFYAPSKEPYIMHPFLLMRRAAAMQVGGYRHVFHAEDTDLYWRLLQVGKLFNLTAVLGEYRLHAGSVSSQSILNGRVAAVNSQLASVSERRRRNGVPDISFPKSRLADFKRAGSLEAIMALASAGLDGDEAAYLRIATASKLLELTSYRPYTLDDHDLAAIQRYIADGYRNISIFNRRQLIFRQIIQRRVQLKRIREAWRVLPLAVLPKALWELVMFKLQRTPQQQ